MSATTKRSRITIPPDVLEAGPVAVRRYRRCLKNGCGPRMAEMLALQAAPRCMTDDLMMASVETIAQRYERDPVSTARICEKAVKRGYRPKPTDHYNPMLSSGEGDPSAFFNHGCGRGELKKRIEAKGVASGGDATGMLVATKGREPETDPHVPVHKLNPKIVERIRRRRIKDNPELARKNQRELRAEIVEKHGHNKDR